MRGWARRTAELHHELATIADVRAAHWWLLAGGAALARSDASTYVVSDAEPSSDTFIGHAAPPPHDVVADAIARAHAARAAIRELDGALPEQPLAVHVRRTAAGAVALPDPLAFAAFAVGTRCWSALLAERIEDEAELAADLAAVLAGGSPHRLAPVQAGAIAPFVCISIGDEPLACARHGHRRAWTEDSGPWLGLGRAAGLALVSTCHLIVDGYGHARLAARIAELAAELAPRAPRGAPGMAALQLDRVVGAVPLEIAWRELPSGLRALPLAYALGRLLHRVAGAPDAPFSPTFQIPVAPGTHDDPARMRRRVVPAIASVRFSGGEPEPFATFAARTKLALAREAAGGGLTSRLLAAARAVPAPLAWKRRAIGPERPRWLEPVAAVLGGRGCVSRIELDVSSPPSCAVSSPARLATPSDPLGGCVVTVIDDGTRAALTLCGSGEVANTDLVDELLALAAT